MEENESKNFNRTSQQDDKEPKTETMRKLQSPEKLSTLILDNSIPNSSSSTFTLPNRRSPPTEHQHIAQRQPQLRRITPINRNCSNSSGKWSIPKGILLSSHRHRKPGKNEKVKNEEQQLHSLVKQQIIPEELSISGRHLHHHHHLGHHNKKMIRCPQPLVQVSREPWEPQSLPFAVDMFEEQTNCQHLVENDSFGFIERENCHWGKRYPSSTSSLTFARLFTTKNARDLLIHHNLVWKFPSACEEFSKFIDNFLFSLLAELDKLRQVKHSLRKISQSDVEYILKNRFGMTFENSSPKPNSLFPSFNRLQQQQQQQQIPEQDEFPNRAKKCAVINVAFLKILNEVFHPRPWKISKDAMATIKNATEKLVVRALEKLSRSSNECEVTSGCVKKWCYGLFSPKNPIPFD